MFRPTLSRPAPLPVAAGGVILLSDIDGLYDRNPAQDGAVHIARVERIDAAVEAMADTGSASGMGSGGMVSKIAAGSIANAAGAHLAIASEIGRAHVRTPVTNANLVCRLLPNQK